MCSHSSSDISLCRNVSGRAEPLRSHDPVHQLSVSSRKLHFLFQFHRKQEVPARFVPIQSSIHTCASHLSLNATSHNWCRRYCCFLEALRQISETWADRNVFFSCKWRPHPWTGVALNFPLKDFQLCVIHKSVFSEPQWPIFNFYAGWFKVKSCSIN